MTGSCAAAMVGQSSALTVDISPTSVSAYGSSGAPATLTTTAAVATPTGGVGPYGYAWAQVGASSYTWTANTPSAAATTFTANTVPAGGVAQATWKVVVTDATGAKGTAQIDVFANNGQPYDPSNSFGGRDFLDRGNQ